MRIDVVAVGKLKERHWREAADEYLKRLRPYATVRETEVPDENLAAGADRAMRAEADGILRAIPPRALVVALDVTGEPMSSEELARWLEARAGEGRSEVAFVIGGSAGLAPAVLGRADVRLSLSAMTFPHQMCRVVLLEQVYRSFRISRNEPYHL